MHALSFNALDFILMKLIN